MRTEANLLMDQYIESWEDAEGTDTGLLVFKINMFRAVKERLKHGALLTHAQLALAVQIVDLAFVGEENRSPLESLRLEMDLATYLNSCS